MYECNSLQTYMKFLSWYEDIVINSETYDAPELIKPFYVDKTEERKNMFLSRYGNSYATTEYTINGKKYPAIQEMLNKIDLYDYLKGDTFYTNFHGDLQFDNVIYDVITDTFTYIDWRESFANSTKGGDLYYDLGKLYSGCVLPYVLFKEENNIKLEEGTSIVNYSYTTPNSITEFQKMYERWIINNKFDLEKVKFIANLIYLNISPLLQTDTFNKILWFKSIEGIYEFTKHNK